MKNFAGVVCRCSCTLCARRAGPARVRGVGEGIGLHGEFVLGPMMTRFFTGAGRAWERTLWRETGIASYLSGFQWLSLFLFAPARWRPMFMLKKNVRGPADALFDAIHKGDVAAVADLLDRQPELLRAVHGYNHHLPLHHAVYWGQAAVAQLLIERGADVRERGHLGLTPLHMGWVPGTPEVMALLLERGAEVDARDDWGATPLFYARSAAIAELLIQHGADVNARRKDGSTVLQIALHGKEWELVRVLLKAGVNPNVEDCFGWTPLMWAVCNGYIELMGQLIEHGATFARGYSGTLLHLAAAGGCVPMIEHLLARGEDVNARDRAGWTPLHAVVAHSAALTTGERENERKPVMECLISHGADITLRDHEGRTCLHIAVQNGTRWLWKYLLKRGATMDPFMMAGTGRGDLLEELLIEGAKAVKLADGRGYTLLHWAAMRGMAHIAELLLKHGADADAVDGSGDTALHMAVKGRHIETARELLRMGASPDCANGNGDTPFMLASYWDDHEGMMLLVGKGAAVNHRNHEGSMALHGAACYGTLGTVALLLSLGAEVNAVAATGRTPVDLALRERRRDVVWLLKRNGGRRGKDVGRGGGGRGK